MNRIRYVTVSDNTTCMGPQNASLKGRIAFVHWDSTDENQV
jgi:hypothetical protein